MRAAQVHSYGTFDRSAVLSVTEGVKIPDNLKEGEILIDVKYSSLNPVDYKLMEGYVKPLLRVKFPYVPGMDFSGVVVRVGPKCNRLKIGDKVWGKADYGGFGQYLKVKEKLVGFKPAILGYKEAAACPLAGMTVHQALHKAGKLRVGDKVLILGGSGGTGTFAIQIAKAAGAFVATTCSARNTELVRALGVNVVIDYTSQNWWDELRGQSFALVLDTVGQPDSYKMAQQILSRSGRFVTIAEGANEKLSLSRGLNMGMKLGYRKISGMFVGPTYTWWMLRNDLHTLDELKSLVEKNLVRPVIEKEYDLSHIKEAFAHVKSGHSRGKTVIAVQVD